MRRGEFHGGATTAARAARVLRASVATFFHDYHCYTSVAGLLVLPFSAAVLAAGAMASSSNSSPELMRATTARLRSMFHAAGFPPSSPFFALLVVKLSQTAFTFAASLPFSLTFLLLAKSCVAAMVVGAIPHRRRGAERDGVAPERGVTRVVRSWPAMAATYMAGAFVAMSANAAVFSLMFLAFNLADLLGFGESHSLTVAMSAAGAIVYSVAIGVATVVCGLAVVVAAVEHHQSIGPFAALIRACVVIRGRVPVALALAVPTNLAAAAAEALFQLRVVSPWRRNGGGVAGAGAGVAGEAFSIAYIHAVCVVMEMIVSCVFYRSCKRSEADEVRELEPDEKGDLQA
uniref:Uncharacterized protein n=1 Tax=Leersia perrieri TaxID=77586 RepID=A0A0D9Y0S4_9ORYZ